jgi:hypothetical protein
MTDYSFNRGVHETVPGAWDIDNPDRTYILAKEIETALPGKTFIVIINVVTVIIRFNVALTSSELTTLETTVSDHKNNT